MPPDVILALDQGSSSTRCVAYDRRMHQRGSAVRRVSTYRPSSGMVEHDPDELLAGALEAISEVVAGIGAAVAGIGIASQTESFVLRERGTGRAVTPVVSWQDQRAAAMLGDQQAALYGQGRTLPRMATLTLGAGAFLWLNVGAEPAPPYGVLATAAWDKRASGPTYALEAFCANAGNALDMLPGLGFAAAGASRAPDWSRPHPVVVPAPAGLGTPRWHGADRVTVLGASSTTTAADLAAAGVAGVAHKIADALEAVDARRSADVLRVGGGLSAHEGLLQAVADLSGLTLEVAADPEATARGIATLAAEAAGLLDGDVAAHAIARQVAPRLDDGGRARERSRWEDALEVHVRVEA